MSKAAERSAHARKAKKTPKPPKPWDIPRPREKGDKRASRIFLAVGKALSNWEHVENQLANLFSVFVGADITDAPAPAMRAYGTVISFKGRAEMLDAAARAYLRTYPFRSAAEQWPSLLEALTGFSGRRNDFAHGSAEHLFDFETEKRLGVFLLPGLYVSKKYPADGPPSYRYVAEQIVVFAEQFSELANRVHNFRYILQTKRRPAVA